MGRCGLLVLLAITGGAHAQLRPKRVGTNALGEQQMAQGAGDMASGGGDMAANLEAMAAAFGGGDGEGGGRDVAQQIAAAWASSGSRQMNCVVERWATCPLS